MALHFVFSVASKFAGYFGAPICSELGYIISYTNNVDKLKTHLQTLEAAKVTLQQRIDAAKQNGEKIFDHVQDWLGNVDDKQNAIVAMANGFLNNEEHACFGCAGGSFLNPCTRYQQSKKATEMVNEISEVLITLRNFNGISYLPRLPVAFTPSARGYEALHSRTSILNEIMSELKDANVYMIGLYGMGGVGKSTLIKEVAWQAEHDGSFGAVVVATVTNSPDVKRMQDQLADGLGLKFNEVSGEGGARRLWDRIRKETKILVIIDDIWKKIDLTEVGVPFGDDHKGCKLLLTSRNLNVLNSEMGTQKF